MTRALVAIALLISTSITAQQANTVYNFLKVPASPIASALGGSQVATAQSDVSLTSDNPALGDSTFHDNLSLGYLNYVSNINQASVFYARDYDSIGIASVYLRYFDYGSFDEYDQFGNQLGTFRVSDYELGVSFSRPLHKVPGVRYGATFKQIYSNYYLNSSYGLGLDLGAHYTSKNGEFTAGVVADNIGFSVVDYTRSGSKPLPFNLKAGVAKKFKKAPIRIGVQYNNIQRWDLAEADVDAEEFANVDALTGDSTRRVFTVDNFIRHLSTSVEILPSENFNLFLGYNFRNRLELALNQGGRSRWLFLWYNDSNSQIENSICTRALYLRRHFSPVWSYNQSE